MDIIKIDKIRREEAFRYMAVKETVDDEVFLKNVDDVEADILRVCKPQFVYRIFEISEINKISNRIYLKNCEVCFEGRDIVNHLDGCEKVAVMACTASQDIDRLLRVYFATDVAKAVIADAMSSVLAEQICDEAQRLISQKNDGFTTWRYSCGYGDFPLEAQADIVRILNTPKTIGVSVTDSCMLVPQKSVTAVFGISRTKLDKKRLGCENCNMYDTCNFRKRGERCEI